MKKYFLGFAIALLFTACQKDEGTDPVVSSNAQNIIMPLGASRVEGARPEFESYRYELWKKLVDGNWDFDFIGSMQEDADEYAEYVGKTFDTNHEGHSGFTSSEIKKCVDNWLKEGGTPNIVLFSSPGGNDALQNKSFDKAVKNVNDVIEALQAANPDVTIIIEELAPAHSESMTHQLADFLEKMQKEVKNIAAQQSTSKSQVITVDMATGFKDDFLADDIHYNEAGAAFIASRYYDVMQRVLLK